MLLKAYPTMRMHQICKLCRGDAARVLDKQRCGLCRKTHKDYKDANLEREIEEFKFLRETWLRCKKFTQNTTGTSKLDLVIHLLFGKPHDGIWRDYTLDPKAGSYGIDSGVVIRSVQLPEQYVPPPLHDDGAPVNNPHLRSRSA